MAIQIKPRASAFRRATEPSPEPAKSMSQKYFVSPEIFADEQKRIFSRQWLLVGHQSQIAKPGDYFLATVAGENLIVVRDQRSQIRGFYNVCRHRGTRLKEEICGNSLTIQCPYHSWTYGLDGRLTGAPHMDEVRGFDKADYPLNRVNLGIWEGFIFVNLESNAEGLENWFAPLNGKFSAWNIPHLRSAKRIEYEVRANWKLMFENYSECYHCPAV
ncbi:MAG TPA: aromatic ring-hydroxylating dioxygenase subunit alpha, partial [Chthoniobacterales bacterium]|nr:aromatic ring-hydroxylating dioxygenase subunit alpha [Chthoniobacterales bacterium]